MHVRATTTSLVLGWLLALPALGLSLLFAPTVQVDVGAWGDHANLTGMYDPEQSSTEDYRWTTAHADATLPVVRSTDRLLVFRAHGWRPTGSFPHLTLTYAARPLATIQMHAPMRVYQVLVPVDPSNSTLPIGLDSETYQPTGDPRQLGIALDWLALHQLGGQALPGVWQFGGQALLLVLTLAVVGRLVGSAPCQARIDWAALGLALFAGIGLVCLNLAGPLWVAVALPGWIILAGGLLVLVAIGGPWLRQILQPWMSPRQAQHAVLLFTLALALRLAGAIHPFFDAHDLPVHDRWMHAVTAGQLYLYSTPAELQNRLTFNPPASYVLFAPLWLLLGDLRLTIQAATALIDGFGCLALLGLAYEMQVRGRAGLAAFALYAALPINLTILWWGFAANDVAQSLGILLFWLILRLVRKPGLRLALIVGVVTSMTILTHVGVLVLIAGMLGLLAVAATWQLPRCQWISLWAVLSIALLATLAFYFSAAAIPVLQQPPNPNARSLAESLARGMQMRDLRLSFVGRAFTLGFTELLLGLLPSGVVLLWRAHARPPLQRNLLAIWLGLSFVFFAVYLNLGYLTRYIYFGAPLICLAGGVTLHGLMRRPGGRIVGYALIALVACVGVALWFGGVLLRDKPSLIPLTQ